MSPPPATVVITTRNRKDELRSAIRSALDQTVPLEVLVIDDGSTDGTPDMVAREFPTVLLHRSEQSEGCIRQRNRGAELATAPVIFSIDDDAAFTTPRVVEQTLREFDHPRIGAVAIPFVNVRQDSVIRQQAPSPEGIFVSEAYIGTAHALRRDVFLALGGYRDFLVHQGEEGEYCTRMLEAGYVVRLGRADVIHHFESPRRDLTRLHFYGSRNALLYAWYNVPMPQLLPHAAVTTVKGLAHAVRVGALRTKVRATLVGFRDCARQWSERRPVRPLTYGLVRRLRKHGPLRLEQVEPLLPPLPVNRSAAPQEPPPLRAGLRSGSSHRT